MPADTSTAITIDRLVKRYPGAASPAVDHVSLTIEPGELFFLLGPSGCGKTTLLRMIAGFIDPTEGRILFARGTGAASDVTHLPPNKRNTGMVFQSYALWPHMTVAANVAFGLEVRKVAKDEMDRRVMDALKVVEMDQYAQRKPNALSGGQQQRVALARALVVRPDVLLLDEPLSNLDAKLRVELRSQIRKICKQAGITTVYVTHDQKEALSMADRVAIMQAGRVVQMGGPGELYRKPGSKFVAEFLGETNFLHGTITESRDGGVVVSTPAGTLFSAHAAPTAGGASGASSSNGSRDVLVSLRPEALRPVGAGDSARNTLSGRITDTTYLGELAQHLVELKPSSTPNSDVGPGSTAAPLALMKVALLNPGAIDARTTASQPITLSVAPEDVVLVPRG